MTDEQRAQLDQLRFFRGIVTGELALVSGCAEFLAGLSSTMQLDHRAELGRQQMAAAIETLRPLLQLAAHQLTGQIAGLAEPPPAEPPVPAPPAAPSADAQQSAEPAKE